jgi:SAM-dependent methyltransferase
MSEAYRPAEYWEKRLTDSFDLRGVGHQGFPNAYNRWVYRRKADALTTALARIPAGELALDIGSGVGWVVEHLQALGLRVNGVDITDVAVAELNQRFPGTFWKIAIGEEPVPANDSAYAVATMLDVAYHITDDDTWRAAVVEIARLLAPGGRLIVTDRLAADTVQVAEHVRFRGLRDWVRATTDADLDLTHVEPLYRWLSRPRQIRGWGHVPIAARGPIEYVLERAAPTPPHLRWASFTKRD